jgi:hypothetical protein
MLKRHYIFVTVPTPKGDTEQQAEQTLIQKRSKKLGSNSRWHIDYVCIRE